MGTDGSMGPGVPQPNIIPSSAEAGMYSPNRYPPQQQRLVDYSVFMEIVFVFLLYLFTDLSYIWCLCRHDSYSNQYPGQGAPPGGSYPNQQPGMYPQQQLVGKQLIE